MFVKGRIKIGSDKKIDNYYPDTYVSKYVEELNRKHQKSKNKFDTVFFLKNNGNAKSYNTEETFNDIMNSILNEDTENNNSKKNDKFNLTFYIEYCAKTFDSNIKEIDIKNSISQFVLNSNIDKKSNIKILEHSVKVEKAIDVFDNLAYNNPSALNNFYKDLLNEKDISILSETFATLTIKKKDISELKYNKETLISKYQSICKNDKIKQEIDRIFTITDNKNIQGLHYLFSEDDFDVRTNEYRVLANALYSMGRLNNPYYYIVEIDVNDRNFKSNMLYLKTRLKISRNDLYFFEFMKKTDCSNNNSIFESDGSAFNNGDINFFNTVRENQFINTFGFYADEEGKRM